MRHSDAVAEAVGSWWRKRRHLRSVARDLTQEFARSIEGVGFRVKAHGLRQLELFVWPESGLDDFIEPCDDSAAIERASSEF